MKKLATLALVLSLGVAAVATTGCSGDSAATKSTTVKTTPSGNK